MWELRECAATVEGDLVRNKQNVARNTTVVERRGGRKGLRLGGEPGKTPGMRRLREIMRRFFPKVCVNLGGRLLHAHREQLLTEDTLIAA